MKENQQVTISNSDIEHPMDCNNKWTEKISLSKIERINKNTMKWKKLVDHIGKKIAVNQN